MNYDIGDLLNQWPFDPDEFSARWIKATDGTDKIQIRIDMGILQLELEGRPDSQRPHGYDSLLDYYHVFLEDFHQLGGEEEFILEEEACEDLFQEAWQYYHRYLSLFYLEEYARVLKDTEHNLRIFDLIQEYAENDEIKWYFEQYYPHALMMQARAQGMLALEQGNYPAALRVVREGIERIENFIEEWYEEAAEDDFPELSFLREWHEELEKERPLSQREQLERDLNQAIEAENFEEAARLRDKLLTMRRGFLGHNPERST